MAVFERLWPSFYSSQYANLGEIQAVVLRDYPESVMISKGGVGFFTFFHQRGALEEPLFSLPAASVTRLKDDEICRLMGELLSIGDIAAAELVRRMNITRRATNVRALTETANGTKLYLFRSGADRFE